MSGHRWDSRDDHIFNAAQVGFAAAAQVGVMGRKLAVSPYQVIEMLPVRACSVRAYRSGLRHGSNLFARIFRATLCQV
jgi:hypothetical protein